MKLTRRKAVAGAGIGALSIGGLFGTGAFSSVEATRGVTIELADDSQALLAMEPNDSTFGGTGVSAVDGAALDPYAGDETQYLDDSGDTLAIDMSGGNIDNASGLNNDAVTTFRDLIRVTNNGTQQVGVNIDSASVPTGLDVLAWSSASGNTVSLVNDNFPVQMPTGTTAGVTIEVDSNQFDANIDDTVTVIADEAE